MPASNDVFISYRRDRGFAWAKLVWDDLRDHGIDAFLDLENVRDAGSFDTKILRQIEGRPYFVIVLTHGSLERCCEEGDWLREELEHALASDRVLVPLVIAPFDFAEADTLGGELAHAIRSANGVTLVPDYFDAAMQRLRDDRLVPIEIEVRSFDPSDEAFAAEARARASLLPPPTPPVGRAIVPPPPDAGATEAPGAATAEPAAPVEDLAASPPTEPAAETATTPPPTEPAAVAAPAEPPGAGERRSTTHPAEEIAVMRPAPSASPAHRGPTGGRRRRRWPAVVATAVLAAAAAAIVLVVMAGGDDGPTDRMDAEDVLGPGDRLETEDGTTVLQMGTDGILRGITGGSVWFSEPSSARAVPGSVAVMQEDGNFVIYESEDTRVDTDATYATQTQGNQGATLVLLDGSFEIRSESGRRLFPRAPQRDEAPPPTADTTPTDTTPTGVATTTAGTAAP